VAHFAASMPVPEPGWTSPLGQTIRDLAAGTLGRASADRDWPAHLRSLLGPLRAAFAEHRAATEGDAGLYAGVVSDAPRLVNTVHLLVAEHEGLDSAITRLAASAEALDAATLDAEALDGAILNAEALLDAATLNAGAQNTSTVDTDTLDAVALQAVALDSATLDADAAQALDAAALDAYLQALRRHTVDVLNGLTRHRQRDADLVYEAYAMDIGGE
jgi:hypothetical protein